MNRLPSTQALQCFESSARLGSFTAAAHELYLTQSAVSRQVTGLEQQLGAALFTRGAQRLSLTKLGASYLIDIAQALQLLNRAGSELRLEQGFGGHLSLSIPSSWGNYWLVPKLPEFTSTHSTVSLDLMTHVGRPLFESRRLDAAVEFNPRAPDASAEFLMPLTLFAYANPTWAKANRVAFLRGQVLPQYLLRHMTILPAWDGWLSQLRARYPLQSHWPAPSGPSFELMSLCMSAAVQRLGVGLLPEYMAGSLVKTRQLTRLSPVGWEAPGGYWLLRSPFLRSEASFNQFSQWLKKKISP
jgi:LysR family transcriptional regulator, glycine cleavage system transcriptional activator